MGEDRRAPDDPARLGLEDVLMPRLGFQTEGLRLLASMLHTAPCVGKAQAMGTRGKPDVPDPDTRVEDLGIEPHKAYALWQHQARIRLRLAWLLGRGQCGAAQ